MTPACTSAGDIAPRPAKFSTRAQIVLGTCACAGATAFLFAVDPTRHAVYPQCLLYNATGIYCAGCGATRALYALLHGNVLQALHDNVLFVAALPVILYFLVSYATTSWRDNAWKPIHMNVGQMTRLGILTAAVLIGFMIVRNIPGAPFDLLRP